MDRDLQVLYLKLDSSAQSLTKIALSQLILKIIYGSNQDIKISTIQKRITSLLKSQISIDRIEEAVRLLIDDNKIYKSDRFFSIVDSQKKTIENSLRSYNERMDRIIKNFFAEASSTEKNLKDWIEDVTIEILSKTKSDWMDSRVKGKTNFGLDDTTFSRLESLTIRNNSLVVDDKEWLIKQYAFFFQSGDDDLVSMLWDFGTSAFCSQLVTSSTGTDQFTIDQIRNTYFFLDTNVLMHLQLEEGEFYTSYKALETIFLKLNIKPCFFEITREEYVATMLRKQENLLQIATNYSADVLGEINDEFLQTAIRRQCKTVEDFNRFFDEILLPPNKFVEELDIKLIDSPEIEEAVNNGTKNEKVLGMLNSIYRRYYYRERDAGKFKNKRAADVIQDIRKENKNFMALEHDAGIIGGTQFFRRKNKSFILTRDKTLKMYCSENTIRNEPPVAIGVDALISCLAIDNGGIDIDPREFKPLFANIIKGDLIPAKETFQVEDLAKMLEVEKQFKELPDEEIKDIAHEVYHMRLKDANGEKTSLFLTRRFQSAKLKYGEELEVAMDTITRANIDKQELQKKDTKSRRLLRGRIQSELKRKFRIRYVISNFLGSISIAVILVLIYLIIRQFVLADQMIHDVAYTITGLLAGGVLNLLILFPKFRKQYKANLSGIQLLTEKQLDEELNGILNDE